MDDLESVLESLRRRVLESASKCRKVQIGRWKRSDESFQTKRESLTVARDAQARGQKRTAELEARLESSEKGDMLDFKLDGGGGMQKWDGVDQRQPFIRRFGIPLNSEEWFETSVWALDDREWFEKVTDCASSLELSIVQIGYIYWKRDRVPLREGNANRDCDWEQASTTRTRRRGATSRSATAVCRVRTPSSSTRGSASGRRRAPRPTPTPRRSSSAARSPSRAPPTAAARSAAAVSNHSI